MRLQPKYFEVIKDELCTQRGLLPILERKGAIVDVEHVEHLHKDTLSEGLGKLSL